MLIDKNVLTKDPDFDDWKLIKKRIKGNLRADEIKHRRVDEPRANQFIMGEE